MLVHGQRREEAPPLRHVADARGGDPVRGTPAELAAARANRAARLGRADAHDRHAERRLAHPVAADDRERRVTHLEGDALEDVRLSVVGVESLDREQRLRRRSCSLRGGRLPLRHEPSSPA